jgi:hypothetical protein
MASADLTFQEVINLEIKAAMPNVRRGAMPPGDGGFPYVQFGQSQVVDDFPTGKRLLAEVHTWSTAQGPHEVKNLQEQIRDILEKCSHTRGGFHYVAVRQQDARVFLDIDGETWHGVQRFRALAGPI